VELEKEFYQQLTEQQKQAREQFVRDKLFSEEALRFAQKNKQPWVELMAYYRCAIMEIETKFRVLNEEYSLQYDRNPIESIHSRIKSMESIARKIRKKQLPLTLEAIEHNIRDIAGVRIVCSFRDDIYELAESFLQQDDIFLLEKKNYIEYPKNNGYRSLHLIVEVPIFLSNEKRMMKVEVQLRTIAMDFWASLEHKLRYKKDIPEEELASISRELYSCAERSARLDMQMQDIRDRIFAFQSDPEPSTNTTSLFSDIQNFWKK